MPPFAAMFLTAIVQLAQMQLPVGCERLRRYDQLAVFQPDAQQCVGGHEHAGGGAGVPGPAAAPLIARPEMPPSPPRPALAEARS